MGKRDFSDWKYKTTICNQCGTEFKHVVVIDGKKKSLRHRKLCLNCSPYKFRIILTCKRCKREFSPWHVIDGEVVQLHNRSYCLDCVPRGKNGASLFAVKVKNTLRICTICGKEYVYDRTKGHKSKRCNSCCKVAAYKVKKERAIAYKGGKCCRCGYDKYYGSLHFHHANPAEKEFTFAWSKSWHKLKVELDKCDLVCANCHGEIHDLLRKGIQWKLSSPSEEKKSD